MAGYEGVRLTRPEASAPQATAVRAAPPVQRRATPPQPAVLQVGSADDALEHAADRAADAAMARIIDGHEHGPAGSYPDAAARTHAPQPVRRRATIGPEGGATSTDFTQRIEGMRSGGRGLDTGLRRSMERGFGASLSGVRVHTGAAAAEAADEIGALAFTSGRDIFFGEGQYRPGTPDGDHMIGHEIAHTLQQSGSTQRMIRRWDFGPRSFLNPYQNGAKIEPLDDERLVLKVDDKNGSPMVVKSEEQPIGLGQLLGKMQKSISGTETIKYRSFNTEDLASLIWLLKDDSRAGRDAKWAAYYEASAAKKHAPADPAKADKLSDKEKSELARQGTVRWLLEGERAGSHVVAMSFAEGETMESQSAKGTADATLDTPGYLKKLGMMTVSDIIFRNRDRIGMNSGNWMTNVDGKITLIDNVDSAGNSMRDAWRNNNFVEGSDDIDKLAPSQLRDTAADYVLKMMDEVQQKADNKSGIGLAGGADAFLAARSPSDPSKTRNQAYTQEFEEGLREARARLIKIFGSTRFSITKSSRKAHADKKKLKAQSAKAYQKDSKRTWSIKNAYNNDTKQFEDRTDRMEVDYFEVLKDRVKKLKSLK